jgi:hypothetical protein
MLPAVAAPRGGAQHPSGGRAGAAMSRALGFAVALGLCALAHAAAAQDRVYRCGADGRSYSQQPCANGTALEVADRPSTREVAQARRVAQLDARLAEALARQRQQAELAAARQGPVLIGAPARVAHITPACRSNSACARTERSKPNKRERADRITLYRAPANL